MRSRSLVTRQTTSKEKIRRSIFRHKKSAAKKLGIKFSLRYEDIKWPDVCPILGTKLAYSVAKKTGPRPNSPSFDRIRPKRGYTPGNVIIISSRANTMKSDAKPGELLKIAKFYKRLERKRKQNVRPRRGR